MTQGLTIATSAPDTPAVDHQRRRALLIVFVVVFIDLLGFGIVLPLLPRYAETYLTPLGITGSTAGLVLGLLYSSFSFMQFLFAPLWGRVSDRIGRRPILLLGLAGSVVFYGLFGYASGLPTESAALALGLMLLSRSGAGVAGATISTAQAVIADTTSPESRSRGMALIGAAFGIGFTFGPLIAFAAVYHFPEWPAAPGLLAAALSFIALSMAIGMLPETHSPESAPTDRKWFDPAATMAVLGSPVGVLVLVFFLSILGFAMFEATLALLTKEAFGFSDGDNYLVFAFVGFMLMFAQGGVYRPLARRVSETTFMIAGVLLMLAGLAALGGVAASSTSGQPPARWLFYVSLATGVTGFAFLNPSVQSLISRRSDPSRQGEILGVNQSFAALSRIIGPVMGLWLFKLTDTHTLPYFVGAGLLLAVLALTRRIGRDS
jgi:MFS family permease